MSHSVKLFREQHYSSLKRRCVLGQTLFEDPCFPANTESLFYTRSAPGEIEWRRPQELCESPRLFVDGASSHDLNQGELGNCWFLAAASCLAFRDKLWQKVIPGWKEQDWDPGSPGRYAGIFRFRFWRFGEWTEVVVDDRLPTMEGDILYCHSTSRQEFWSALLEKAYAKLCGCYEALTSGNVGDAMVDFTGAVVETLSVKPGEGVGKRAQRLTLANRLVAAFDQGELISCHINLESGVELEDLGLKMQHSYSVTGMQRVSLTTSPPTSPDSRLMVRLRNPWGHSEWIGPWSDASKEWNEISQRERKKMGIVVRQDGEFWMTFDDWYKYFSKVIICLLINTSYLSLQKTWDHVMLRGAWTRHINPVLHRAGGCTNYQEKSLHNPQFVFDVTKREDEVLVSLQQKDQRIHRREGKGGSLDIGFSIFKVERNREYRLHTPPEKVGGPQYATTRTVFVRVRLPVGRYVIIPTTYTENIEAPFLLRVYSNTPSGCRELTLDKPEMRCWNIVYRYPRMATRIHLHGATELVKQTASAVDPYAVIKCEFAKVSTPAFEDTINPRFDTKAIFYRRNLDFPIVIQVWDRKIFCDRLLGEVTLQAAASDNARRRVLELQRKDQREGGLAPGHIEVTTISSLDLTAL